MQILKNNAIKVPSIKTPLKVTCPYCASILVVEEGDVKKEFSWVYHGKQKVVHFTVTCPCCEETINLC